MQRDDRLRNRAELGIRTEHIISYFTSKSGIWLVISRVVSYFHEPEASANTAYE